MGEAYAWKSARSRGYTTPQSQGQQVAQMQAMADQGRTPVITRGRISGYSSRPGAPNAQGPTGIVGAIGTREHANAWRSFFGPAQSSVAPIAAAPAVVPPVAGTPDIASDESFGGGTILVPVKAPVSPVPTTDGYHAAAAANTFNWLQARGLITPDRSMPAPPFMPQGPNVPFTVPKPITGIGDAGTDATNMAQNRSMFAPGGTGSFWGNKLPPAAPASGYAPTPNPLAGTGYETGNISAIRARYQTPNTATISYGPSLGWPATS